MSVKVKGSRYCPRCKAHVLAQRNGHGVRNTAAIGGALPTAGLSLLAGKRETWRCPQCGGRVRHSSTANASRKDEWLAGVVVLILIVSIIIGSAAHSFALGLVMFIFLTVGLLVASGAPKSAPVGRQPGQYRCVKNDHLLNADRTTCPIDGSEVRQV